MKIQKKIHQLLLDSTFKMTTFLFIIGFIINYSLFYYQPNTISEPQHGTILGRQYPLGEADVKAGSGGTITVEDVTAIISEGTFSSDAYMRVDRTARGNPISVNGLWQISDIWGMHIRYMSNDDEISTFETKKNYTLSFPYDEHFLVTEQGEYFPESTLKLIRGETITGPWEVLDGGVVDVWNNTVSLITNRGGYYMIAGGYYVPTSEENAVTSAQSTGESSIQGIILKENEMVVTIAPTPPAGGVPTDVVEEETHPVEVPDNFFTAAYRLIRSLFNR